MRDVRSEEIQGYILNVLRRSEMRPSDLFEAVSCTHPELPAGEIIENVRELADSGRVNITSDLRVAAY